MIFEQFFEIETWIKLKETFEFIGPIYGVLLPIIESFLPFLPLWIFVMLNFMLFGFFWGFIYAWIGTSIGTLLVYLLLKKFGRKIFIKIEKRYSFIEKGILWVDKNGNKSFFVLLCFPFVPTMLVSIIAATSNIKEKDYIASVLLGKFVMLFFVSVVGFNIYSAFKEPLKLIYATILFLLVFILSKILSKKIH